MSMGFEEYLSVLDDKDLEEIPVDIDTFVEDEHYLGKRRMKLSPIQRECVLMMTQMYRLETLESFMDEKSAQERWSQTKKEIILQLGKGCHAPYTPVYNAETGSWQRLDSFDQYNNTVIGYTDGKLTPEYATESFLEGEGRMLRVVTRLGFTEDVYEGHKYYAWKNKHFFKRNNKYHKGPEWIEAKDLDASYKIAIGAGFDVINPINIPEAHATFLGYVIGDGCCPNDQYGRLNVDFHEDETDSMAAYRAAVDEIGDSIKFTKHPKKKMFYVTHGRQMKTYSLIKEYGLWGSRAQDKFIPDAVWRSDNNILAKFMSALWATDGSVYLKKLKSSSTPVAEYCTISERLAHDVQRALLRLGIAAGIRSRRPTYTYKKEKKTGQTAYYITVSGSENFKRFASVITLFDQKQSKAAGGLDIINRSSYRQNMYHQGLYWDNIKSIEDIGNGLYWTMTQPNSSNYLGNGCISQQSGKDELSAIAIAYIVYLLLCLRDPAAYYKKPAGDNIDILNIAINSDQAKNVFFKKFNNFITVSPWFQGRYDSNASGGPAKADKFEFDKNITVYSGHSEKEAWEGYNCRTPDVEALTREGWKTYDRLTVGEEIYTIDHETGAGEWQPLERINVFDVDEDIIRFSGKHFTATSTADHRWPTITRYGTRRWKTTSTLNTGDNIPLKATNAGLPTVPKYDDNFVELIAWYMTEGTINRSHTEIYQSAVVNPDNVNRIRKCLTGCFGPGESSLQRLTVPQWRENLRRGVVEFKMNRVIARVLEESAPGRVPTYEFMNSLTLAQLELFISVCMLADNRGPDCFAQKNYQMAEVFAFACIQTGRAISCREVKCGDYKMLNVRIRRKSVVNPIAAKIERQIFRYQGKVWCPTVKNGTWLSREGGTVHFTGNCIAVVLDEISGFAIESASPTGKTAQGIYDMYKASVVSRFAGFGKLICLSFPRYKGDFITKRYNEVIGGKQVVAREVVTKINDELPDGVEGNELVIQWEEDHIDYYTERWVYALRRPPWDVNPTVSIEDYVGYFLSNYTDAMGRFACMPPDAIDAFFKDRARIEAAMDQYNGWDHSQGQYADENIFAPEPGKEYFVHVDLAQKHDRCAVAMAHVEKWVRKEIMGKVTEPKPFVRVDLLRFWEPKIQGEVDFQEVQDFIVDLQRKGFNLRLVTFDQWRSEDMRKYLNSVGIRSELLSIKKEQYVDFAVVMQDYRLKGPKEEKLIEEMTRLRLFPNGKIDHTRRGYKDLSDATCGAIFNAVTKTRRDFNQDIEIMTLKEIKKVERNRIQEDNVIVAPSQSKRMPQEIADLLERFRVV